MANMDRRTFLKSVAATLGIGAVAQLRAQVPDGGTVWSALEVTEQDSRDEVDYHLYFTVNGHSIPILRSHYKAASYDPTRCHGWDNNYDCSVVIRSVQLFPPEIVDAPYGDSVDFRVEVRGRKGHEIFTSLAGKAWLIKHEASYDTSDPRHPKYLYTDYHFRSLDHLVS